MNWWLLKVCIKVENEGTNHEALLAQPRHLLTFSPIFSASRYFFPWLLNVCASQQTVWRYNPAKAIWDLVTMISNSGVCNTQAVQLTNRILRDQDCVLLHALLGFPPHPPERAQWVVCVLWRQESGPESQLCRVPAVRSGLTGPPCPHLMLLPSKGRKSHNKSFWTKSSSFQLPRSDHWPLLHSLFFSQKPMNSGEGNQYAII